MEKLYKNPNSKVVVGYSRDLIQDVFRSKYYFVPNLLTQMLQQNNGETLSKIRERFGIDISEEIDEYINFLKKNELAYFSGNQIRFSEPPLEFKYPAQISNAIVLLDKVIVNFTPILLSQLSNLGCEHIQFFCSKQYTLAYINTLLSKFDNTNFSSVELIVPYNNELGNIDGWKNIFEKFKRLKSVMIFKSPQVKKIPMDMLSWYHVLYIENELTFNDCGTIHPLYLQNNLPFFTESQCHNTCLNRKLCIDAEGNIKNCPSMQRSFGNIKDTTLAEAIEKPGFKDLWFIHKDKIDVCKDCEFRHMCSDCRCFIKDPENIYSQPAKCTYNPYICKWQGQEGYVPVEDCGTYTKETGFVPDHEKIEKLNEAIWGEE